jgi:hypothetical protein
MVFGFQPPWGSTTSAQSDENLDKGVCDAMSCGKKAPEDGDALWREPDDDWLPGPFVPPLIATMCAAAAPALCATVCFTAAFFLRSLRSCEVISRRSLSRLHSSSDIASGFVLGGGALRGWTNGTFTPFAPPFPATFAAAFWPGAFVFEGLGGMDASDGESFWREENGTRREK